MITMIRYFLYVLQAFKLLEPHIFVGLIYSARLGQDDDRVVTEFNIHQGGVIANVDGDIDFL